MTDQPAADPARTPVIVGVGQVNDRPAEPTQGLDPLGLMEAALRAADADAGGGWLEAVDAISVVDQISFPALGELPGTLAARIGASPRIAEKSAYGSGDSPVLFLNMAANRIGSGEATVCAVAGGEALRTAAARAAAAGAEETNAMRALAARRTKDWRGRYGLVAPVDVYPLYENACRAAWGQSLEEAQGESAAIWSKMSEVAAENPGAWLRQPRTPDEVATPSASNRPIAFPYLKLMVANASVNQGAAFIVTSLAEARARGVSEDRLIHIGAGAAAHEPADFLARDRYDRSAGMETSLRRTLELNGLSATDLDHVELYSCFPCVPKLARRAIGWPVERPATVFGGLTFGGGPIGNYMGHAIVSMVQALRREGRHGLLFANGGYATLSHAIVLSRAPVEGVSFPQAFDVQAAADAARGEAPPLVEAYSGPAEIETFTVLYARDGAPRFGVVVARTAEGARTLARVPAEDAEGIAFLTDGTAEPVGTRGTIAEDREGTGVWRRG